MPKHKSKPLSVATNANSLFKSPKNEFKEPVCIQNVNVEVNIDQKDDCVVGCFKALAGMFKSGS